MPLHCRGLAEDDAGLLADAVESYSRGPRPLELALAAEDAGRAMGRLGRLDRARGLLDQAAVIYERLEAAVHIPSRGPDPRRPHLHEAGISSRAQLAAEVIRQPGRG